MVVREAFHVSPALDQGKLTKYNFAQLRRYQVQLGNEEKWVAVDLRETVGMRGPGDRRPEVDGYLL